MSKTLDELVKIVQFKLKLNQEDIADRLGYSRGHLSKMIKNNDVDCIEKIKMEFPNELQIATKDDIKPDAATPENVEMKSLVQANKDLSAAVLILSTRINSNSNHQSEHAQACLERIAEQGAGLHLHWKDKAAGLKVLSNFLTENVKERVKVNS